MINQSSATLIATLGTEPQVVTATLDLLLKQKQPISSVSVLHTSNPGTAISAAVERLQQVAQAGDYANITFHFIPITHNKQALSDVDTLEAGQAAFTTLYHQVWQAKRAGLAIHLCIAGGRKTITVYGMVTAQLLFDEDDHLYHLFSGGDFLASKRLHPCPGDEVALVPIPVILWSRISPAFNRLQQIDNPFVALEEVEALQIKEKMEACRAFVLGSLTPSEERAVRLLVTHGMSDQEIADQLFLSPRTVEQHLRSAYAKASDHWELANMTRTQLVSLLNLYYATEIRGKPA
jgi:CRISPR-associated Csx14 family protein